MNPDLNQRIKEVRKNLKLSQEEFGNRLGVTRGAITNIEYNKIEPKPLFVELICNTFNVNEHWLRTGEGEMFEKLSKEDTIAEFIGSVLREKDDTFKKRYIQMLSRLDEKGWEALRLIGEMWIDMEKNKE